jgi:hypothetical protein
MALATVNKRHLTENEAAAFLGRGIGSDVAGSSEAQYHCW